jgi:hypothetical protein
MKLVTNFNRSCKALLLGTVSLLSILGFNAINLTQANASNQFERRDGIYGEIKYIRACNRSWGSSLKIIAEAGSDQARVQQVDFKGFYGSKYSNPWVGYTNNTTWRHIASQFNQTNGDKHWYGYDVNLPLTWFNPESDMKFSIHVLRQTPGISYRTVDLGSVKQLGKVPLNECRIWDDGNLKDF